MQRISACPPGIFLDTGDTAGASSQNTLTSHRLHASRSQQKKKQIKTRACQAVVGAAVAHLPAMTLSFHVQGNWSLEGTLISPSDHRLDGQTGFNQGCLTPKPTSLTTWLHCPSGAQSSHLQRNLFLTNLKFHDSVVLHVNSLSKTLEEYN